MGDSDEGKDLTAHPSHPPSAEISREALIEHIILQEQYAGPVAHPHIAQKVGTRCCKVALIEFLPWRKNSSDTEYNKRKTVKQPP